MNFENWVFEIALIANNKPSTKETFKPETELVELDE